MSLFERLERIIRGFGSGLGDIDPDELLRRARRARAAAGEAPDEQAGGAGPRPTSPGGLSPEVARAYANLELEPPASLDEAKTAWRRLMARYHPDKHQGDPKKTELATKVAARLTEAYRLVREHLETRR